MIQVRDLAVHYGSIPALDIPHLDIAAGECVLITGPSGCGKSTLARVFTGLIPQAIQAQISGTVRVAGLEAPKQQTAELAQHIGTLFQNPATQLFHLKVEDDVAFGPRNLDLDQEQIEERVQWSLQAVGISDLRQRSASDLSGGQKQLVALAAALAMQPKILVLDEPTASLDVRSTRKVVTALLKLRRELDITIVIIEHRLAEIAQLAERIVIMEQGRIVTDAPLAEVLENRKFLRQMGLRRPVDAPFASWESLLTPHAAPLRKRPPLLSFQEVSAGYNGQLVLQDLNLALYPGEFTALVGDNGAGKSTLSLLAAGLLKPAAGKVDFNGQKRLRAGLDVSLLFQDPTEQLFTATVDDEVAFAPHNYRRFNAQTHHAVLTATDLLELRARGPLALSMGQQQRTALAACLALQPQLLILDEPTLGQDWGHLQQLMDFLTRLNKQGTAILLITHDFKLVHRYTRRVVLLQNGRIVLDGQVAKRKKNEILNT
jgi:energy-coupling factor transport system ATP-binding protein